MSALAKATLQPVTNAPGEPKPVGAAVDVQFNPTSLRFQLANNVDVKKAFGKRPVTQYDGTSSATLAFDLVFDTADEGTTESPVDVRDRVNPLRQFLLPAKGAKSIPARVQFVYGTFRLVGIITALNVDYDLFSASGVPVRAKCAVTIKEQLPEYEAGQAGPGSNTGAGAVDDAGLLGPGASSGPGGAGPAALSSATAMAGESAADFAVRVGLDPAGWPGLDLGGLDPLSLSAGAVIDFSASVSAAVGFTAGVTVGASATDSVLPAGGTPDPRAITAAGGLQGAIDTDLATRAGAAASATRGGFVVPDRPAVPGGTRAGGAPPAVGAGTPVAARAPGSPADQRASTFGLGVPLRDTVGPPRRFGTLGGAGGVPTSDDPTVPGWLALRAAGGGAAVAVAMAGGRCGCAGASGCGCGGGRR